MTSTQTASAMYNKAKNIASGKIDLEVSMTTVMGILFLGFFYMVTSSIGMSIYSKCDAMKGQKVQDNLNKYLAATLTIGLTIPFTSWSPSLQRMKVRSSLSSIPSWVSLAALRLSIGL